MARGYIRSTALALALIMTLVPRAVPAESAIPAEYLLKAGFLFHFSRFVEWPTEAYPKDGSSLDICVAGSQALRAYKSALDGKPIRSLVLKARAVELAVDSGSSCHILFISADKDDQLERFKPSRGLLVVTEKKGALNKGAIINFISQGRHVRFEIDLDAAKEAGFKMSSELLKLAVSVKGGN